MTEHCAIEGCPGPGERRQGEVWICALDADSGVVVVGHDERGQPRPRRDLSRIRFSASSQRGRLFRAILER